MEKEKFDTFCLGERTFTTVLCCDETVSLKPGGELINLTYDNRLVYAELVREKRLNEFNLQVSKY